MHDKGATKRRSEVADRKKRQPGAEKRAPLTKRELEILRLFTKGLGSRAVAQRLSISYVTARNHAQQILVKLGVHSRLAAVARAHAEGLIETPADYEK